MRWYVIVELLAIEYVLCWKTCFAGNKRPSHNSLKSQERREPSNDDGKRVSYASIVMRTNNTVSNSEGMKENSLHSFALIPSY